MEDSQIEELYGVDSNADEDNIPGETLDPRLSHEGFSE